MMNKYHVWKSKSSGEPIFGTDRIISSVSARKVVQHLAFEEGVEYHHNNRLIRCKDGTIWYVLLLLRETI